MINYKKNTNHIGYETNNVAREIVNFFLVPLLNSLPQFLKLVVKKTHKSANDVIKYKTSHKALEIIYNKGNYPGENKEGIIRKIFKNIWFNMDNSKAVRNRLKAVEKEIIKEGQKIINKEKKLKIFSIASGSARAIIESIQNIKIPKGGNIFISFLDKNPEAIKYSKNKISKLNLNNNINFEWCIDTASNFNKYHNGEKPNIIEMVGLLDYFDDKKAENIFKKIYDGLENDGIFITANIDDNRERKFITNFIDWKMIYRNNKDLERLAQKAGFKKENIKTFYEPLGIHSILIAKKC